MRRALKFVAGLGLLVALILAFAVAVQFQVRLRLVVGEPVVVDFSKGAWVECLATPVLVGKIHEVQLQGIVVSDTSGSFTSANTHSTPINGQHICGLLGITVVETKVRQYYIPFRFVGGLKKGKDEEWFWSNPFAT